MPVSKLSDTPSQLLDINNFGGQSNQRKIAICERVLMKRDAQQKLFVSYIFRDVKGKRITGRQFNLKEVDDVLNKAHSLIGQAVIVTATISFFHGPYLDVSTVYPMSSADSKDVMNEFFIYQIDNYEGELSIYNEILSMFATSPNYLKVYDKFDTLRKLIDGYNTDICNGFKSSPILLINNFSATLATFVDANYSGNIVLAYIFIQAIESASEGDPLTVLKQLTQLGDLVKMDIDIKLRTIYEITYDTLLQIYNLPQNVYTDKSIVALQVHNSVYSLLKMRTDLEDKKGVFQYGDKLYRKG